MAIKYSHSFTRLLNVLVWTCLIFSISSHAQEKSSSSGGTKGSGSLTLKSGASLKSLETPSDTYSDSQISPSPIALRIKYQAPTSGNFLMPFFDMSLSYLDGSALYAQGMFGASGQLQKAQLIAAIHARQLLSEGNHGSTPYDNFGYGGYFEALFDLGWIVPGISYWFINMDPATIGGYENLSTRIKWDQPSFTAPYLIVDLNYIKLLGKYTIYNSSNTSVASKDFGIALGSTTVKILTAGVGFNFGGMEIWGKYQTLSGIDDGISYYYQAPFLTPEYLLAKEAAFVEVTWKF